MTSAAVAVAALLAFTPGGPSATETDPKAAPAGPPRERTATPAPAEPRPAVPPAPDARADDTNSGAGSADIVLVNALSAGALSGLRGLAAHVAWTWHEAMLVGAGVRVLSGSFERAQADYSQIQPEVGATIEPRLRPWLAVGVGGHLTLAWQMLTRAAPAGEPAHQSRLTPTIGLHVEVVAPPAAALSLVAAIAGDLALGPTRVSVSGQPTSQLPLSQIVTQIGLRCRF